MIARYLVITLIADMLGDAILAAEPSATIPTAQKTSAPDAAILQRRLERAEAELKFLREQLGPPRSQASLAPAQAQDPGGPADAAPPDTGAPPESALDPGDVSVQSEINAPLPQSGFAMPGPFRKLGLSTQFGNGFELKTDDDEFSFQLHDLTQFDARFYSNGNQQTVKDSFVFPRQWFIFNGRLTKPYEYFVSIAEGFDTLNILDVFLNIHYDDRLQLKIGRFKTPFTYEFYIEPIFGLINPERSLFFNNFGVNRDLGMMAWGQLKDKRIDYAVGVFNGTRNGFIDSNNAKDVMTLINLKPFLLQKGSLFENFNTGFSMDYGDQNSAPIPRVFRTTVATTGNEIIGVPFLALNDNVREIGPRNLFSYHAAWYYKQFSAITEYQTGTQSYGFNQFATPTALFPIHSVYSQLGAFVTGETVSGRGVCEPIRPFDIRKGKFGLGAWELFGRYNTLNISRQVFDLGFANPNLWTNDLYATSVGFNWYWNQYLKMVFEWDHYEFSDPVAYRTTPEVGRMSRIDLFLTRFQVYF